MGLEAHSSLARLKEAWPTVKGLAGSPDDAAEWAGRKPDGKALRMAALQRAISHADADARTAALFAMLEAGAKGALKRQNTHPNGRMWRRKYPQRSCRHRIRIDQNLQHTLNLP